MRTTLSSFRWSSTHWAVTSALSRDMVSLLGGGAGSVASGSDGQEVDLAAQAEAEDRVEQGGRQRQPGGDQADEGGARQEPEEPDDGEREADGLRELRRGGVLEVVRRAQAR